MLILILTTVPDRATADKISQTMMDERLAACVHILPAHESVYRWEGKIHHDAEINLIVKTTEERYDITRKRILDLHPYAVPFVARIDAAGIPDPYMNWARESLSQG